MHFLSGPPMHFLSGVDRPLLERFGKQPLIEEQRVCLDAEEKKQYLRPGGTQAGTREGPLGAQTDERWWAERRGDRDQARWHRPDRLPSFAMC